MTIRSGFFYRPQEGEETAFRLANLDRQAVRLIARYARPWRGKLVLATMAMLAASAAAILMPYLTKVAIDRFIIQGNGRGLMPIALIYVGLAGLYWSTAYWQGFLAGWVGYQIVYDLRRDLYRHLLRQSMTFYRRERIGQITSRLGNDTNELAQVVSSGFLAFLSDLLLLLGGVVVMVLLDWRLALILLLTTPLVMVSIRLLGRRMRNAYHDVRETLATMNTGVEQGVSGMRVVQSLGREASIVEQFEDLSRLSMEANLRVSKLFAAFFPIISVTNMLGTVLVLVAGGTMVANGMLTLGTLVAFLAYVQLVFGPLRELSLLTNWLQSAAAALDRIADYFARQPEVTEPEHPQRPAGGWHGELALHSVTFSYDHEPALQGVNLRVGAGQTVALVGPTGAGKSTLAALLARLYDVQEGAITMDGIDLRLICFEDLRRLVAVVPQDPQLFPGTIADNIRYGRPEADPSAVEWAARLVQADVFIEALPDGYNTLVGEGGVMLSGGQRQLVALARALLVDPQVLILDEAMAHVDAQTEALIRAAIAQVAQDRTMLVITHRFSTLRLVERIIVMDRGRVYGQGSHEQLLARSELYRDLYQRQRMGEVRPL